MAFSLTTACRCLNRRAWIPVSEPLASWIPRNIVEILALISIAGTLALATAKSRKSPARRRWIRILAVFKSVLMIAMDRWEEQPTLVMQKLGGFCVTVERVVYETRERKAEDARETTLCLQVPRYHVPPPTAYIIYKVGSDEAVADRLVFCSI